MGIHPVTSEGAREHLHICETLCKIKIESCPLELRHLQAVITGRIDLNIHALPFHVRSRLIPACIYQSRQPNHGRNGVRKVAAIIAC